MKTRITAFALVAFMAAAVSYASAAQPVVLKLSGAIITKVADGTEKAVPLSDTQVKPGQTIRFEIVATNQGTTPVHNLVPVEKISAGTAYEAGSATPANAGPEFSLDGGKTWSAKPMITVHTPNGDVTKPADPAIYTNIRWAAGTALAPSGVAKYSYEVVVK
jgi:uncharacterized repeat protein (TIGR01451 family)